MSDLEQVGPSPRGTPKIGAGLIVIGLGVGGGWFGWRSYRVSILREEAARAARMGDWPRAEAAVERLASYEALDLESSRIRTTSALARRDTLSAARFLGMTPENAPQAAEFYERQGFLLRDLFRLDEAEAAFRRSIRVDPQRLGAQRALVAILGLERRAQEQEASLWQLLDRSPSKVEALRVLAQGGSAIPPDGLPPGMDEGQALARAIAAEPTNDRARAALITYLRGRGETEKARDILQAGDPASPILRLEALATAIEEGNLEVAALEVDESRIPNEWLKNPRFLRLKGDFLDASAKHDEAVKAYEKALELDPRGVEIHYRLGQALLASKKPKEAEPYLAYARETLALKNLVAQMSDEQPEPKLCREAEQICRRLNRSREADAWHVLAGPDEEAKRP